MTFTVKPGSDGAYIQVTHAGDMDLAEMEAGRASVAEMMKTYPCKRLFIDLVDAVPKASMTELFHFASSLSLHFPDNVKVSVVEPVPQEESRFIENVAVNRGVNVRHFCSRADAFAWLLGGGA